MPSVALNVQIESTFAAVSNQLLAQNVRAWQAVTLEGLRGIAGPHHQEMGTWSVAVLPLVVRFIVIDDLGHADLGFTNNNQIHTPEVSWYACARGEHND